MERQKLIERLKDYIPEAKRRKSSPFMSILLFELNIEESELFIELLEKEEGKKENFYCGLCGKNTGFDFPTSSPCCGALVTNEPNGAQIDEQ